MLCRTQTPIYYYSEQKNEADDIQVYDENKKLKSQLEAAKKEIEIANYKVHELEHQNQKCIQLLQNSSEEIARKDEALRVAINTVECDSLGANGEELPWYRMAKKALQPNPGGESND